MAVVGVRASGLGLGEQTNQSTIAPALSALIVTLPAGMFCRIGFPLLASKSDRPEDGELPVLFGD